ncbi:hypothetical protein [Thiococcus pfennigii]|uniref:hypothetical protein n=1 Tax=Thiococcus pfennigii TaxID=1057 RepID=UPI0030B8EA23
MWLGLRRFAPSLFAQIPWRATRSPPCRWRGSIASVGVGRRWRTSVGRRIWRRFCARLWQR